MLGPILTDKCEMNFQDEYFLTKRAQSGFKDRFPLTELCTIK